MAQKIDEPEDGGSDDDAPIPDTPETLAVRRAMAARLDCHIEEDIAVFYKVLPSTLRAWSKRGKGPRRVRMGNAWIYPNQSLAEDRDAHDRRRGSKTSRSTL